MSESSAPAPHSSSSYRPDVDGLRAVAVLLVIAFHASPSLCPGGFVGVSVFFTISGFLITRIILHDLHNEHFSFATFYARRIKRIFPASFVCLIFVCGASLWFPISVQIRTLKAAAASAIHGANFFFSFGLRGGYLGDDAAENPLLNYWSLSVEEQFYMLWPAVIVACHTFKLNGVVVAMIGAAASFAFSQWLLFSGQTSVAYFMLPARGGELLLGAAVAWMEVQKTMVGSNVATPLLRHVLSLVALSGIVGPAFYFSSATPFPGLAAFVPCASTAGLIFLGCGGDHHRSATTSSTTTIVAWFLGLPPFVMIGLASFSAYLYHWPVLVFARLAAVDLSVPSTMFVIMLFVAMLTYVSFNVVEQPLRKVTWPSVWVCLLWVLLTVAFVASCVWWHSTLLAAGMAQQRTDSITSTKGVENITAATTTTMTPVPTPVATQMPVLPSQSTSKTSSASPTSVSTSSQSSAAVATSPPDTSPTLPMPQLALESFGHQWTCIELAQQPPEVQNFLRSTMCRSDSIFGTVGAPAEQVLVFGDSHAMHHVPILHEVALALGFGFTFFSANACPAAPWNATFLETAPYAGEKKQCGDMLRDVLAKHLDKAKLVVIGNIMNGHVHDSVFLDLFRFTFNELSRRNKTVLFLGQVPVFRNFPRSDSFGGCPQIATAANRKEWRYAGCFLQVPLISFTWRQTLMDLAKSAPNVHYFDMTSYICPSGMCSAYHRDFMRLYFEQSHLSFGGSWFLGKLVAKQVPEALRRPLEIAGIIKPKIT